MARGAGRLAWAALKPFPVAHLVTMNVLVVLKDFFKDAGILYWAERVHGWEL